MTSTAIPESKQPATFWAAVLFGFAPFVMTVKLPPSAEFWAEWVAALLATGLLLVSWRNNSVASHKAQMPVAAIAPLALAALVSMQLLLNRPHFVGGTFLAILQLLLAGWLCATAATWRSRAPRLLDGLALGLLAALAVNVAALGLELAGWHVHGLSAYPSPFQGRATGLVGQPNQLATFAAMAWCAGHFRWLSGSLPAWALVLTSVLVAMLVAASGSRAGSLAWLLAMGLALAGLRGQPEARVGRRLLVLAAIAWVVAQLAWGPGGLAAYFSGGSLGPESMIERRQGRLELWRDSLQLIALHPLFGVGWRNFASARWNELSTPLMEPNMGHAHNLVLNLAVELGIVGALVVLVPLGWALWRAMSHGARRGAAPHQGFLAGLLGVIAAYSMLEFPLWYANFLMPFALALGLADGPSVALPVGRLRRPAHFMLGALALALTGLVGLDYRRTERVYTEAEMASRANDRSVARLPMKQISDIALLTTTDLFAELMLIRVLDADGLLMQEKLRYSERVLGGLATKETVARHISFLIAAGKADDAEVIFQRAGRNPDLQRETLDVLTQLSKQQPTLVEFVQAHRRGLGHRDGSSILAPALKN